MKAKTQESAVKTSAFFVPNHGQYPQEALFAASAKHTQFYFMKSRILHVMELAKDEADGTRGVALSMGFVNANPDLSVQGVELYEGKVNYFIGSNADKWKSNIPTYGQLRYNDVWEGISLSIRHTEKGIKLDWHIAAGTNPDAIRLTCEGADSLSVSDDGSLVLTHPYGEVHEDAPVAYQMIDGRRVNVPCGYRIDGALSYGFWLDEGYDPARELIIDPLLPYATLLGGSEVDIGRAIAVDAEGCAYITGSTLSPNFPITPGAFQADLHGSISGFVTKFSADGSQLLYSTYLGGSDDGGEGGNAIAIDSAGHAYVAGATSSTDFPVTPGAFQTSNKGAQDCFVTKLSPDGASLVYSTYLGGNASDFAYSIRVDADGFAYVGGDTGGDFPTTPGAFQPAYSGGRNGFISKLSADGTALIYSTYLGGSGNNSDTYIYGIAIDTAGSVYATGTTFSPDFPVTPGAFQTTLKGYPNAFVTKFSPDGSSLVYSTFVGGSDSDQAYAICADEQGNAYVSGTTSSADFPVTPSAPQSAYGGGYKDAFVLKLSVDGSALVYSTYLGGNDQDWGSGIALASGNRACVTGYTYSSNFPTTPWVRPSALQDPTAVFLTIVSEDGTSFMVSNYIGGFIVDFAYYNVGIAIGTDGSIYIAGSTASSNFPVTPGAFQTTRSGVTDAFVYRTKFALYAKASVILTKL
ncbi:MAG TPA: SBBP repeat-containing protein [Clostridiales bacterium]|nr:SBBP repeat-containing protein [Clostridiales bacterium]